MNLRWFQFFTLELKQLQHSQGVQSGICDVQEGGPALNLGGGGGKGIFARLAMDDLKESQMTVH